MRNVSTGWLEVETKAMVVRKVIGTCIFMGFALLSYAYIADNPHPQYGVTVFIMAKTTPPNYHVSQVPQNTTSYSPPPALRDETSIEPMTARACVRVCA